MESSQFYLKVVAEDGILVKEIFFKKKKNKTKKRKQTPEKTSGWAGMAKWLGCSSC